MDDKDFAREALGSFFRRRGEAGKFYCASCVVDRLRRRGAGAFPLSAVQATVAEAFECPGSPVPISTRWDRMQNRPLDRRRPRRVPDGAGAAPAPAAPDQAALTSIVRRVAARGAGTLTSSMPFAPLASTWAASTPSGIAKLRWNAPYATSRTK